MALCLWTLREVQDHYFHEAKREGYVSRAAYKLIDIDDRKKVLHKGDWVLDCGAAPGSWLQVAAARVGPTGVVVGIDLQPMRFRAANVRSLEGDFTQTPAEALLKLAREAAGGRGVPPSSSPTRPQGQSGAQGGSSDAASGDAASGGAASIRLFDVIVSDMAPNTTGDPSGDHFRSARLCEALLDRCAELLRAGGSLVMKVFEGEQYPQLVKRTESMFESARGFKPKASRGESREMFIIAAGHKPQMGERGAAPAAFAGPARRPSAGWAQP